MSKYSCLMYFLFLLSCQSFASFNVSHPIPLKVLLVGDLGVGRTSLMDAFEG